MNPYELINQSEYTKAQVEAFKDSKAGLYLWGEVYHTLTTIEGKRITVDKYQFNHLVRTYNEVTRFANKAKATATVTTKDIFNEVHAVDLRSNFKSKRDID